MWKRFFSPTGHYQTSSNSYLITRQSQFSGWQSEKGKESESLMIVSNHWISSTLEQPYHCTSRCAKIYYLYLSDIESAEGNSNWLPSFLISVEIWSNLETQQNGHHLRALSPDNMGETPSRRSLNIFLHTGSSRWFQHLLLLHTIVMVRPQAGDIQQRQMGKTNLINVN